jgi:multiple sugar transport system substrate-binding protein
LAGGFLPSLRALYDDPEVEGAIPVVDLGREAIRSARSRPSSPYYSQMSPRIAEAFTSTLRGDHSGEEAAQQLAADLRAILRHGG